MIVFKNLSWFRKHNSLQKVIIPAKSVLFPPRYQLYSSYSQKSQKKKSSQDDYFETMEEVAKDQDFVWLAFNV